MAPDALSSLLTSIHFDKPRGCSVWRPGCPAASSCFGKNLRDAPRKSKSVRGVRASVSSHAAQTTKCPRAVPEPRWIARRTAERLGRAFETQGEPLASGRGERARPRAAQCRAARLFACYEAAARGISVSGERAGSPRCGSWSAKGHRSAACCESELSLRSRWPLSPKRSASASTPNSSSMAATVESSLPNCVPRCAR